MKSLTVGKVRSVLIAMTIAVALTGVVTLCPAQQRNHNDAALNSITSPPISGGTILGFSERTMVEPDSQDSLLIAQVGGLWCYTSWGRYPMLNLAPIGSLCNVNVSFYPYVLQGTVGY